MRLLFLSITFWISASAAVACDRCGCSLSGHYLNALPQYQRQLLGMRWFHRVFASDHHGGQFSDEYFHSWELWGQFFPRERLQVVGVLPFNYFIRTLENQRTISQGVGDALVFLHYNVLSHSWGEDGKQQLWLGGGVKWPTGKFDPALRQQGVNPNMQPGTGALDVITSGTYMLRHNRWGLAADALFRFCQPNGEGYRFGHRLNANTRFFYQGQLGSLRWMPTAGAVYEWSAEDQNLGDRVHDTGGYCLLGQAGIDLYGERLAVSLSGQIPVIQYLGNGLLQARQRVQLSLSLLF